MNPKKAIAMLKAAFSHKDLEQATIRLYEHKMRDIGPELLEATVNRLVDRARFFPTIAEIRETAASLSGLLPMSSEEALAIIRQADVEEAVFTRATEEHGPEYRYSERRWEWPIDLTPSAIALIWRSLAKIGDPTDKNGKAVFGWDQDFKKVYVQVADQRRQYVLSNLSGLRVALPAPPKALAPPPDELGAEEPMNEEELERARERIRKLSDSVG